MKNNGELQIIEAVWMRKGKNLRANEMIQRKQEKPCKRYQEKNTKEKF